MKIPALRLALALLTATAVPFAAAQDGYPNKPVRFVNNFPAGGPSDLLARSVAAVLQETLKQPFVVENKAGVAGNIGAPRRPTVTPCCSASTPPSPSTPTSTATCRSSAATSSPWW